MEFGLRHNHEVDGESQPGTGEGNLRKTVETRLEEIDRLLEAHAGGARLVEVSSDGAVTVRFTGMCVGCPLKPVTMTATVRPGLLAVNGVTSVEAEGARISAEAEQRLSEYLSAYGSNKVLDYARLGAEKWRRTTKPRGND